MGGDGDGRDRALSTALVEWESLDAGALRLLGGVARAARFDLGVLWIPSDRFLVARVVWREPGGAVPSPGLRVRRGETLAGSVWDSAKLQRSDFEAAVGVPACAPDGEVVAVLTFATAEAIEVPDRLLAVLAEVGSEFGTFLSRRKSQLRHSTLSARELEILQLSAQGLSMTEIAEELEVSRSTVKSHLDHIYRKLRVSSRTSAVAEMMRQGVIT